MGIYLVVFYQGPAMESVICSIIVNRTSLPPPGVPSLPD